MRFRDLKRTHGEMVQPAWPPTVWASSGEVFTSGAQGVLKGVRRIRDHRTGDWLAITSAHDGREHHAAFRCDGPPTLTELERVLREQIGRPIKEIGDLQA